MLSFSIFRHIEKKIKNNLSSVLNTFENIMVNGAFAQNAPFPLYFFEVHDISKASKGPIKG